MRPSRSQRLIVSFAVVAMLLALAGPVGAAQETGAQQVGIDAQARDSWIVTVDAGTDPGIAGVAMSNAAGGHRGQVYRHALNGFQFKGSAQAAEALRHNKHVVSVEADRAIFLTETLPYGIERVYAYGLNGFQGAYQRGFRGNGARIAILDTGIDLDHPDLASAIDQGLGKNCVNPALPPNDGYGHGTHTAGTAAAPINGVGVAGIAPQARLVAVKMFDDAGNSSEALALCAFDHIIGLNTDADPSNDIDVASMSWGEQRTWGTCETDALHGAVCRAEAAGIIQVAGAGNSATNAGNFVPAAFDEVVSVSAIADFDGKRGGLAPCRFIIDLLANECDDSLAVFSNFGSSVEVTAPGVNIYSTWKDGGWKTSSGTSMATPHVSGIMALMAAAAPGLTPAAARAIIKATGECPNGTIADSDSVAGCAGQGTWRDDTDGIPEPMANALEAALRASASPPPPPPPPDPTPPSAPALSASAFEDHVDLSWTAPSSDGGAQIDSYEVYRGDSSGTATFYATVDDSVTTFEDTSVTTGSTYWYQVAATNSVGTGDRSNEVSATIPEPPPPPPPAEPPSAPTLSASPGNALVNLSWTVPTSDGGAAISAYEIYRGTASGVLMPWQTVPDTWTSVQNIGLTNGTTYYYQIRAVNSAGAGAWSNEASAKPMAPVTRPSAPRSLKAVKTPQGAIQLTWLAPTSNGGSAITSYKVYRTGGAGSVVFTVPASQLTLTDATGAPKTWYAYVVSAVNSAGESQASNIVTIKTL